MKKEYLFVALISMLVFLLTCWTANYTVFAAGWAESIAYFALTYVVLRKFAEPGTYGVPYVVSIIVGRLLLEAFPRAIDFSGSLFSMFVPMLVVASVILASVYYRERKASVLILAVILLIVLNTTTHDAWIHLVRHK